MKSSSIPVANLAGYFRAAGIKNVSWVSCSPETAAISDGSKNIMTIPVGKLSVPGPAARSALAIALRTARPS